MPSWWKTIHWHHTKKINKSFETCMSERLYRCTNQYLLISAAANIRASWLKFVESQFRQRYFRCYCLFFWNAGPGRNSALLEHLEETKQWPFVDIDILKVLVRWMKQSYAINILISNLKLSLIHFCLINWCLNGCFIPFRNKTMRCIVSSWLMCLIQYALNFEGFD